MQSYYYRAMSAAFLLGQLAWATSIIGEPPSGKPFTWLGAWAFALLLAINLFIGYMAGRESKE